MATSFGNEAAFRCLAQMRLRPLFRVEADHDDCATGAQLAALSAVPFNALDEPTRMHLAECTRCSSAYANARGEQLRRVLPPSWNTALTHLSCPHCDDGTLLFYGSLSLETLQCEASHADDTFPHSLRIQVKLVITPEAHLASIVLLDVPEQVTDIWLHWPLGDCRLAAVAHETGCFEADMDLPDGTDAAELFVRAASEGTLRLAFASGCRPAASSSADEFTWLLHRFNVVEQEYEYILPCGLVADTHINVSRLCEQDYALDSAAAHVLKRVHNVDFDVVLSNGWAMDMVAQRLLTIRERLGLGPATNVMCIGYAPVTMLGDIVRGSKVLILVDVVVTGGQLRELQSIVAEFGGKVAQVVALCSAAFPGAKEEHLALGLCRIPMAIAAAQRSAAGLRERRIFNPFSCCMTKKSGESRSPTEFLGQDAAAAELWKHVDLARAYEHHRIERGAHYIAFINTHKLINDEVIGETLVERLAHKVRTTAGTPEAVLVPNRTRACELAGRLVYLWTCCSGGCSTTVVANHRKGAWELDDAGAAGLAGKRVLVVDSAAGYGRTVDQLARKARVCGAVNVGAAVLISRLPPGAESALNLRLTGGFVSLYSLPIQPVVIRAHRRDLCPICRYKDALQAAASMSGNEAIERWAKWLSRPPKGQPQENAGATRHRQNAQLTLFPRSETADFLESCSGRVASGVTLHALNAAKSDGMAALTLPELANRRIPAATRASMLRHLPPCVLQWSDELEHDIEGYLSSGDSSSVWQAAVEVLSREKRRAWIEHLGDFIRKCRWLRSRPAPSFWSSMACNAYIISDGEPEFRILLEESLVTLSNEHHEACAHQGLGMMLHAIRMLDGAHSVVFQATHPDGTDETLEGAGFARGMTYPVPKPR